MDTDSTLQTGNRDLKNRQRSCPGWTCDNSPTFQRWVDQCRDHQVPKGRLKRRAIPQPSLRDWTTTALVLPNVETLGYYRPSLGDEEQFLVALDSTEANRVPFVLCAPLRVSAASA
ncbi:MAG TPA: hypothetical protein VFQ43_02865, partial [Nitrososphaera sp.]|nr:hypothetical protein [Nitrososphaera sp.]